MKYMKSTLVALAIGLVAAPGAQAQSKYVMTTLKPASPAVPLRGYFANWAIDPSDQVFGSTEFFEGYTWLLSALAFRPKYTQYVARWPATTASSVSPVKALAATNLLATASPDGRLLAVINGPGVYDTSTKKLVAAMPRDNMLALAMNNAGVVLTHVSSSYTVDLGGDVGTLEFYLNHAHTWSSAKGEQALPEGGGVASAAWSINASGTIAGQIVEPVRNLSQAVLWSGGQVQGIPQPADTAAVAVAVNDKGQVLLRRAPVRNCLVRTDKRTYCEVMPDTLYLRDNGTETVVQAGSLDRWVATAFMNNADVVVGRQVTGSLPIWYGLSATRDDSGNDADGRAFIWQQGTFSDLTDWVSRKGVTLPAGAVLTRALAINDKGSIVAQLRLANGTSSIVRLTAKP
ncbi:MAG: hypothetical protein RI907_1305 [Pseudomonadota bacterium]|jgi:hypothetical protein